MTTCHRGVPANGAPARARHATNASTDTSSVSTRTTDRMRRVYQIARVTRARTQNSRQLTPTAVIVQSWIAPLRSIGVPLVVSVTVTGPANGPGQGTLPIFSE